MEKVAVKKVASQETPKDIESEPDTTVCDWPPVTPSLLRSRPTYGPMDATKTGVGKLKHQTWKGEYRSGTGRSGVDSPRSVPDPTQGTSCLCLPKDADGGSGFRCGGENPKTWKKRMRSRWSSTGRKNSRPR